MNLNNGKDATGHISLRSAIQAADTRGNQHHHPAERHVHADDRRNGEDTAPRRPRYHANLTIKGKGSSSTIIDGNTVDRVFQVLGGKVSISNVTIQHGRAAAREAGS